MLDIIELTARGQSLTTNRVCVASGLVNEIRCIFHTDWEVDETRAIFVNEARNKKISVVLVNGECNVPHEVLLDKGSVSVNLVGSVVEGETLVERMTSYKTKVIEVEQKVNVDGANTVGPTPSEFEQFVRIVDEHIDEKIGGKADTSYVDSEIERVEAEIPTELRELESDSTHRTVTDAEKEAWNAKSEFSGSYNDLTDVPSTFPPSEHNHDTRYYTQEEVDALLNQPLYPRG